MLNDRQTIQDVSEHKIHVTDLQAELSNISSVFKLGVANYASKNAKTRESGTVNLHKHSPIPLEILVSGFIDSTHLHDNPHHHRRFVIVPVNFKYDFMDFFYYI